MADNENMKTTPSGKVVCTDEGCFFVSEGEETPVAVSELDPKAPEHEDATFAFARMVKNQKYEDIPAEAGSRRKVEQIAEWAPEHVAWVDERLTFKGRIERDDWMSQAKKLAAGGKG